MKSKEIAIMVYGATNSNRNALNEEKYKEEKSFHFSKNKDKALKRLRRLKILLILRL